jgi:hypothetical protein
MILVKIYRQGDDVLLGACDKHLLGKKFEDGKFQLDVSETFYGGQQVSEDVLRKYLQEATIANLVGEKTVACAVKEGIVDADCILRIKGVPHAQMVRML